MSTSLLVIEKSEYLFWLDLAQGGLRRIILRSITANKP